MANTEIWEEYYQAMNYVTHNFEEILEQRKMTSKCKAKYLETQKLSAK